MLSALGTHHPGDGLRAGLMRLSVAGPFRSREPGRITSAADMIGTRIDSVGEKSGMGRIDVLRMNTVLILVSIS